MINFSEERQINILLIEDNPGDVRLILEAFRDSKINHKIHIENNGEDALDFLYKVNNKMDAPSTDIILLDLNLPKIHGLEILKKIKEDGQLKKIPVIVLTTSKAEEDILKSYENHVNCFITKPEDFDKFVEIVKMIHDFWFSIARLPIQ